MFYTPGHVSRGTEGVGSHFFVLSSRTHFRQVTRASGPILMFCTPGLIFSGTEGVGSRFNLLRTRTHFGWYRGRRVLFLCFALIESFSVVPRSSAPVFMFCAPDPFSAVPKTSAHIFMFCAPVLVSRGIEGIRSSFHVLCARTHFWRNRGRRLPFSCFALPYSFSTVPRASGPVFMFYAP
jgi:hypothetical protein